MRMFTDMTAIHGAEFTSENNGMSANVINKAFLATEEEFLSLVKKQWLIKPQIASVGACCLVGVVCSGVLYIANAGDSRVVLGRLERAIKEIKAVQLSYEHNASIESVREELHSLHPDDPHIVVLKHKVWRVKGLIQVNMGLSYSSFIMPFFETANCLLPHLHSFFANQFQYITVKNKKKLVAVISLYGFDFRIMQLYFGTVIAIKLFLCSTRHLIFLSISMMINGGILYS
jgi:hypothetical protein